MNRRFTLVFALLCYMFIALLNSCNKESSYFSEVDTVKVARVFQPDAISGKDAYIESISAGSNFGALPIFTAFAWTDSGYFNIARALIEFDLSSIPLSTVVKSAKISLYFEAYDNLTAQTGENSFTIYQISQGWNERTVTWNNQPAVITSDSVVVPRSTFSNHSYLNIDVTDIVRKMIKNPSLNHGFMLKMNTEFPYKLVVLGSSNNNDPAKHPKLIIFY